MDRTDLTPITIPLAPADRDAYRAADKAWRTAAIKRNDAERKRARAEKAKGKGSKDEADAAKERDARDAEAKGHDLARRAKRLEVIDKAGHGATPFTDVGFDPMRGHLICKREPLRQGSPSIERKRLALTDKQADDYTKSYIAMCEAQSDAADLLRQVEEYKAAHPDLFATGPGEPPPVDPAYEALKTALAAKQATVQAEMQVQGAIWGAVLAGEGEWYHVRMDITTGEIVCADAPVPSPEAPKVVEPPEEVIP